jgi:hypothetical protein
MHMHVDQKTHRTKPKHFPQPVAQCALRPSPYQSSDSISARSVRGNPKNRFCHHRSKRPPTRNTHTYVPRCVFARRRRSSRTRRCWTRSERSTSTCRMRSSRRSCARHGTSTPETHGMGSEDDPPQNVIESTPYHIIRVYVPHSPIYIQKSPKCTCTCTCTCTYLSVDRPPTGRSLGP